MTATHRYDPKLAQRLILDELFDLSLYKALRKISHDTPAQQTLDELIRIEAGHLEFWQKFFDVRVDRLNLGRRFKLVFIILACRVFGSLAIHLTLEAIEVYGVRKYLTLWKSYRGAPLGEALQNILMDEIKHEDVLVTNLTERKINAEQIRNIFLGLNDGLVEILGAVSGFFGAFSNPATVLMAASTTAVAGALSMGAGAFLALNSEREVKATTALKKHFIGETSSETEMPEQPIRAGLVVGASYFFGALVPVVPVVFGAQDMGFSILTAGIVIVLVSMILAFLSGMSVMRRITLNLAIVSIAVITTYLIGLLARTVWGISV
jgi:predicted membrane protein (TIGR00267 family)